MTARTRQPDEPAAGQRPRPSDDPFDFTPSRWRWIVAQCRKHLRPEFDPENVAADIVAECLRKNQNPGPTLIRWRCCNVARKARGRYSPKPRTHYGLDLSHLPTTYPTPVELAPHLTREEFTP